MRRVHQVPICLRFDRHTQTDLLCCYPKVLLQMSDHFFKRCDLVEKLRTLRQQGTAEQVVHPGGALATGTLKIRWAERRRIRDGPVMLGMLAKRTQQARQGFRKPFAQAGDYEKRLTRFRYSFGSAQLQRFIQGHAEHDVHGLEPVCVGAEHLRLIRWQPGAPILLNRRTSYPIGLRMLATNPHEAPLVQYTKGLKGSAKFIRDF